RVAGEQGLERRGRLGVAAGVEMRLAASVQLVGRLAIRIGVLFSRGQNLELTGLAQVEPPRLISALDRGRQRTVLAGKVAVNSVLDAAGVLVRVEVEREHPVGQGERAGRGLDRSLDQRRAGWQ